MQIDRYPEGVNLRLKTAKTLKLRVFAGLNNCCLTLLRLLESQQVALVIRMRHQ